MSIRTKVIFIASLAAVAAFAFSLRMVAIDWGVPTQEIQCASFHPDEPQLMTAVGEINIAKGDLEPDGGHFEGTFTHYVYYAEALVLRAFGVLTALPHEFVKYDTNYRTMLIAGRIATALFDIAAVVLIALLVFSMTASPLAALISAAMLAFAPFEVIHAHYMRQHVIVNSMVVVMMMLSFRMYSTRHLWRYIICAGLLAGFATAARYPSGIMLVLPAAVLFLRARIIRRGGTTENDDIRVPLLPAFALLGAACLIGFFITDPFFFINIKSAWKWVNYQKSFVPKTKMTVDGILDLGRVWTYISYLLPSGTKPFLWAIWYASAIFLAFVPRFYRYTIPLAVLMIVYGYPMAKGYADPMFIRPTLYLFPLFAFAVGMAIHELRSRFPKMSFAAVAVVAAGTLASLWYTGAYLKGMMHDPRIAVYDHLKGDARERLSLGYYPVGWSDWYIFEPFTNVAGKRMTITVPPFTNNARPDYILLAHVDDFPKTMCGAGVTTNYLTAVTNARYTIEKKFEVRRTLFGVDFTDVRPPADLNYPFPVYYLLRRNDGK
ncbi:MAG: hypothetical protein AABZ39_15700 [Spirochaetota bacterium]